MTLEQYTKHYLTAIDMLKFFGLSLILAFFAILIITLITARIASSSTGLSRKDLAIYRYEYVHNSIQRFYEMVFSATSILSFLSVYYLIDRFVTAGEFRVFWDAHSDMLLLLLIVLSCVINTILDRVFVPLRRIDSSQKGSVRLLGMLYIILIFIYIKYIYENNNYDGFIMYFLGLMIGRFVYFDASFKDFIMTLRNAIKNLPILFIGLSYTGLMCLYGFMSGYLLKSNGVLVSTFFAHIFMIVAIFVIHHSHILELIVRAPKGYNPHKARETSPTTGKYVDYEDEIEFDNSDYEYANYEDEDYEDEDYM